MSNTRDQVLKQRQTLQKRRAALDIQIDDLSRELARLDLLEGSRKHESGIKEDPRFENGARVRVLRGGAGDLDG